MYANDWIAVNCNKDNTMLAWTIRVLKVKH